MDALFASRQVAALCALAYGCYLCVINWHVTDNSSVAREIRAGSGLQPWRALRAYGRFARRWQDRIFTLSTTKENDGHNLPRSNI